VIEREPHRPRRRNLLAETRLTAEWVALNYPARNVHFQFRVGHHPTVAGVVIEDEAERRWAENFNRRIDAVIEPPPTLVMIEAKMWDAAAALGRLMEYRLLLPATAQVAEWGPASIEMVLLTAQDDPIARVLCNRNGIRYVFWEPPWIDEFYAVYPQRRRKAAHPGLTDELLRQFGGFAPDAPAG
jgi:hypothetical protein